MERPLSRCGARLLADRRTGAGELARRLAASSDLFRHAASCRSRASNSSPRTTASPRPTLVSYAHKHNEANAQENRDGADDNRSINCGIEDQLMIRR
jgi:glycogen operon protein